MIREFGGQGGISFLPERQEIRRSCLDVSKLAATGRWAPRLELDEGIASLAEHVRAAT